MAQKLLGEKLLEKVRVPLHTLEMLILIMLQVEANTAYGIIGVENLGF